MQIRMLSRCLFLLALLLQQKYFSAFTFSVDVYRVYELECWRNDLVWRRVELHMPCHSHSLWLSKSLVFANAPFFLRRMFSFCIQLCGELGPFNSAQLWICKTPNIDFSCILKYPVDGCHAKHTTFVRHLQVQFCFRVAGTHLIECKSKLYGRARVQMLKSINQSLFALSLMQQKLL